MATGLEKVRSIPIPKKGNAKECSNYHTIALISQARPGMKVLGLVILTCSFLSLVELTGKNVKVLIVLERNMRKHKAFCSCA